MSEVREREPFMNFRSENDCVMHIVISQYFAVHYECIHIELNETFIEGSRTSQTSSGRAMDVCRSSRSSVPGGEPLGKNQSD